jgi:hypothetical protein
MTFYFQIITGLAVASSWDAGAAPLHRIELA